MSSSGVKFPTVRVSDIAQREIIVLNIIGLFCNIRTLHIRQEYEPDIVVHYERDLNVRIKKKTNCCMFFCPYYILALISGYDRP
jgi:hypothetical protein